MVRWHSRLLVFRNAKKAMHINLCHVFFLFPWGIGFVCRRHGSECRFCKGSERTNLLLASPAALIGDCRRFQIDRVDSSNGTSVVRGMFRLLCQCILPCCQHAASAQRKRAKRVYLHRTAEECRVYSPFSVKKAGSNLLQSSPGIYTYNNHTV